MSGKILLTGATGFTGGHLARRLAADGEDVRALVRSAERAQDLQDMGIELVIGDLTDPAACERATEGVDLVYHIAAMFRPENVTREDMFNVNLEGTRYMLDASIKNGVKRFVHCSTIGVHGDVKEMPGVEESPYLPGDYYQDSKTEGEKLAIEYMRTQKLPISIFRPGGIYGPGDLRFLKLFKGIKNGTFIMFGSGEIMYQIVYIDDLVDGIILCGTCDEALGEIFILTGDHPTTLNELVRVIAEVFGKQPPKLRFPVTPLYLAGWAAEIIFKPLGVTPPIYRRRVDFFRKNRAFSIEKARKVLGFQPKITMQEGLKRTAEWYESQGLL